ncbi:MAG: hypothetical protein KKI14_00345, partial [Nanoarchaeota archaeon]|nr:hypothetical protein [Nanoarchaeota archaeon]
FIAESPPERGYFYETEKSLKDSLIKSIIMAKRMKFDENFEKNKLTKDLKESYLKELKETGWHLIDAVDDMCIAGMHQNKKKEIIGREDHIGNLKKRIDEFKSKDIINSETKIILISATVYQVLHDKIKITNTKQINFPFFSIEKTAKAIKELLEDKL